MTNARRSLDEEFWVERDRGGRRMGASTKEGRQAGRQAGRHAEGRQVGGPLAVP